MDNAPSEDPAPAESNSSGELGFPVAGVGASAGGLEAFSELLAHLPTDPGLALVLVPHLAPSHESNLVQILQRTARISVRIAENGMKVERDNVYVLPPAKTIGISSGVLELRARDPHSPQRSVDEFFQSLAHDQGPFAIGVVLSGTATDGTAGLEEIKAAGGVTFAQDNTAEQGDMPRSAIAAGCVDFVMAPQDIARELVRIARHPGMVIGQGQGTSVDDGSLARIIAMLQKATNVDFTHYKPSTLNRRISRRIVLKRLTSWSDYAGLLASDPAELDVLFHDLLIGVTSFFRNPEMFERLKSEVLPRLLEDRSRHDPLRVWVLGCSSGEEAYSYGIAIAEYLGSLAVQYPVQVFATDLNARAIERARVGAYPKSIAQDMSPARLRTFFLELDGGYRVSKPIRDFCVFATHNVLTDTPFSRMDIVSCRNMLIYVEPVLQQRILPLLHYALKPNGYLVLGHSESLGSFRDLFEPIDTKHKIFVKKPFARRAVPVFSPITSAGSVATPARPPEPGAVVPDSLKEMDRILLSKYGPAAVLVNASMEILQFRGDTSPYLAPAPGKASMNLLKMAREGLLVAMRGAVLKAMREETTVREVDILVKSPDGERKVNIEVVPLPGLANAEGACVVLFEDPHEGRAATQPAPQAPPVRGTATDEAVARLTHELAATREYLQSVIEQQEAANEALQSANEEAQSSNEELQSINEELETSKEEIQSANEELATVNDELYQRNRELSNLNNDLVNLIDIAVVMVGRDLRIRRFTPVAERVFSLIAADIGRPIGDIQLNLKIENLEGVLAEVIDSVKTFERELQDRFGRWCLLRVRPYKTLEGRIDGAVLTLFDIDTFKRDRELAESVVAKVGEPLLVLESDLTVRSASQSFYERFGTTAQDTEHQPFLSLGDGQWNKPGLRLVLAEAVAQGRPFEGFEMEYQFPGAGLRSLRLKARPLVRRKDEGVQVLIAIEDVTEKRQLASALEDVARLTRSEQQRDKFLTLIAGQLRNPITAIQNATALLANVGAGESVHAKASEALQRQVGELSRLIDDLFDTAQITHGKIELRTGFQDIGPIVEAAIEAARPLLSKRRQRLRTELMAPGVFLDADAPRLRQVILNLLRNASAYSEDGAEIGVRVSYEDPRGEVCIRVRDQGAGIDAALLPHVFDLFGGAKAPERRAGDPGAVLTVARRLVQLHGGSIEARSEGAGRGSEFIVRLRARRVHAEAAAPASKRPEPRARRILLVDANTDAAEMLAAGLALAGNEVRVVHDIGAALEKAREMRAEAVVIDVGDLDGENHGLALSIRKDPGLARAALIALTAFANVEQPGEAASVFDRYVEKPVGYDAVNDLVGTVLESRDGSA